MEHRVDALAGDRAPAQSVPSSGGGANFSDAGGSANGPSGTGGTGSEASTGGTAATNFPNANTSAPDGGLDLQAESDAGTLPSDPAECTTDSDCDDGIECTRDACDLTRRTCSVVNLCECDDDVDCDDGIECTLDACDRSTRVCTVTDECECASDADCTDDIECTQNTCDLASRRCLLQNDCQCLDDEACEVSANPCVSASCSTATHTCVVNTSACECAPATGAADCDDGLPCTNDACIDFACVSSSRSGELCDDLRACTSDDRCQPEGDCLGDDTACQVPADWSCAQELYANGECDCGCGAVDFDCDSSQAAACEACHCSVCESFDGCDAECPVDPANNAICPWSCPDAWYRDTECDCGCGLRDPDCSTGTVDECLGCWCQGALCSFTDTSLAFCENPLPPGWDCNASFFGDTMCDCGCGNMDVDCATVSSSCDFCFCPGTDSEACPVSPANMGICTN